jgi:hypothetical protein
VGKVDTMIVACSLGIKRYTGKYYVHQSLNGLVQGELSV